MITIHERLAKIEQQNVGLQHTLSNIERALYGNGQEGLTTVVKHNVARIDELCKWKYSHTKSIRWWSVFAVSIAVVCLGILEFIIV